MYRTRWPDVGGGGRRANYAAAAGRGGDGGRLNLEEQQKKDQMMRKLHTLRLELEGNRKVLGKGQIFTAMKDKVGENDHTVMSQEELATLLLRKIKYWLLNLMITGGGKLSFFSQMGRLWIFLGWRK